MRTIRRWTGAFACGAAVALVAAGSGGTAVAPSRGHWVATDLGPYPGSPSVPSSATLINNRGDVVVDAGCIIGFAGCRTDAPRGEFLWRHGKLVSIGRWAAASVLTDGGEIAGNRRLPGGEQRGFYWKNGRAFDLPTVGGPVATVGGIDSHGAVVGVTDGPRVVVWRPGSSPVVEPAIEPVPPRTHVSITADARGRIFGQSWSDDPSGPDRTMNYTYFLWRGGQTLGLEPYGQPLANRRGQMVVNGADCAGLFTWTGSRWTPALTWPGGYSCVRALNDRGVVAGTAGLENPQGILFRDGKLTRFRLPARDSRYASMILADNYGILMNNRGQLAITVEVPQPVIVAQPRAYVRRNGQLSALPTLGGKFSQAIAMNEAGAIVGWTTTAHSLRRHAVLWTFSRN